MTIRFRNRLTLAFFIISLLSLLLTVIFTCIQYFSGNLVSPDIYTKGLPNNFIFGFKEVFVYAGIFTLMAYACLTSLIIYHSFEKTQAPDIVFFLLFLLACLCDGSRILVTLFGVSETFSMFLLKIGNIHLFSILLAPLSLMGNTALKGDNFKQYTDRNCLILIILSLFFAEFIPTNTAVILPNFGVSYGYVRGIRYFTMAIILLSTIALYLSNKKSEYKQIMTLGFLMLSIGYTILFYCWNFAGFVSGTLLLGLGTFIYLTEVHRNYLWVD